MMRKVLRWAARGFLALACLVLVVVVVSIAFQQWKVASFEARPPLGQLIDVGGHRLHLYCSGEGPETVILESGGGSWSMDWNLVQGRVEKVTRVCSYDRAGFGWSETGPAPRSIEKLVGELNVLLAKAGLKGPFVMVGASFGGSIVQLFERSHPELVSAIVLVDGRSKDFDAQFNVIAPAAAQSANQQAQDIAGLDYLGLLAVVLWTFETRQTPPDEMPSHVSDLYSDLGRLTKNLAAGANENIVDALSDQQMQKIGGLGEKPLVVIVHGQKRMFQGLPEDQAIRAEMLWSQTQRSLATLSSNSRLVVAEESGHEIPYEQPDLIAREVETLIAELRQ